MKYFAYGSNMDSERIKKRGINYSKREAANLKDYTLKFNKVACENTNDGYANIESQKGEMVEGILYEINQTDISNLDKFEGCPKHYERIKVKVTLINKKVIDAIAYIAHPSKTKEGLKPRKEYLEYLLKSREFLSTIYVKKLESIPTLD